MSEPALNGPDAARGAVAALARAFTDYRGLELMVRVGLGENLSSITSPTELRTRIDDLVGWALARGKGRELARAAVEHCAPAHRDELRGALRDLLEAPAAAAEADHAVLARLYPEAEEARSLAERAGIPDLRASLRGAPEAVWYRVVVEARARGRLDALLAAVREDYPANPLLRAPTLDEAALRERLYRLTLPQLELLVFRLGVPPEHQLGGHASLQARVAALLEYARAAGRLPALGEALAPSSR